MHLSKRVVKLIDTIEFSRPVLLRIGTATHLINGPSRLVRQRAYRQSVSDETGVIDYISDDPIQSKLRFLIGGTLYSSTKTHADELAGRLIRKDADHSVPLELHLTESRTRINRRGSRLLAQGMAR